MVLPLILTAWGSVTVIFSVVKSFAVTVAILDLGVVLGEVEKIGVKFSRRAVKKFEARRLNTKSPLRSRG